MSSSTSATAAGETTRVVVLGGGYAGTMAANRLSAAEGADVTLVNPRTDFVHRIRLHQWAAGTGTATEDYRDVLNEHVRLIVDTATRIDRDSGQVELASGDAVAFDHLVYAVGSSGAPGASIPGVDEHAFLLGEWEDAQRLRDHLSGSIVRDTTVPVTVIGGGLTGIEMAAELADTGLPVRLVCRGVLAPSFGQRARRATRRRLRSLGVTVLEDTRVDQVGAEGILVTAVDGIDELPSATTIVTAGFGVPNLAAASGLTTDEVGRLVTDETLTSVDDVRIVGAGDAVTPSGVPFRMSCQAANQLGPHAADTVAAHIADIPAQPVRLTFVGQCMSLGRSAAVVQVTRPDDSPRSIVISARPAAAVKELVCRSVSWGLRLEARRPGSMPAMGRPRELPASAPVRVAG